MEGLTTKEINIAILCVLYLFIMGWYFRHISKPRDWQSVKKKNSLEYYKKKRKTPEGVECTSSRTDSGY